MAVILALFKRSKSYWYIKLIDKESNFKALRLERKLINKKIDVRNLIKFKKVIQKSKPDFIFHLAAQSLVKRSYNQPIETFNTNSIGTLNLLESLKNLTKKCTVVIITSDKSYKNLELKRGYKEDDLLGGVDPYSASKASAELIFKSYFKSFLEKKKILKLLWLELAMLLAVEIGLKID